MNTDFLVIGVVGLMAASAANVEAEEFVEPGLDMPSLMMYTTDVGTVSLTGNRCAYPELINLPYEVKATHGDVVYTGCWNMRLHSDTVQVAFPDDAYGEVINLKKEWFKEASNI